MDDIIARVESARKRNRNGFDGNGKVIRDTLKEFRRTNNINVWIEEDENGEEVLVSIDDDEEFDRIADIFDDEFADIFYDSDEDSDSDAE